MEALFFDFYYSSLSFNCFPLSKTTKQVIFNVKKYLTLFTTVLFRINFENDLPQRDFNWHGRKGLFQSLDDVVKQRIVNIQHEHKTCMTISTLHTFKLPTQQEWKFRTSITPKNEINQSSSSK